MKYAIVTNDLQFAAAYKHEERKKSVESFLPGMVAFLKQARKLGLPVFHLALVTEADDPRAVGVPEEKSFVRGSIGAQILEEVYSPSDIVLEKPKDSGFFKTNLEEQLRQLEVDTLIICGMQAQICIQTTAADAHFRDFDVIVPKEGVVSTRPEDVERALKWLAGYCAKILTYKEIFDLVSDKEVS